jgi:hypothetical protein
MNEKQVGEIVKRQTEEAVKELEAKYFFVKKTDALRIIGTTIGGLILAIGGTIAGVNRIVDSSETAMATNRINDLETEATKIVDKLKTEASQSQEISLGDIGAWKEILTVKPGSAIKIEAYSSENEYIQSWDIYIYKALEAQDAGYAVMKSFTESKDTSTNSQDTRIIHSGSVEWKVEGNGTLRVRKTEHATNRLIGITSIQVLRGEAPEIFVPLKEN